MNGKLEEAAGKYRGYRMAAILVVVAGLLASVHGAARASINTDGLQLYSSMDDTTPHEYVAYWVDAAGNGYDGQSYNPAAYDGGGNRSMAASFNGTSRMTVHNGYNSLLDAGTTDFSVSFWYNHQTAATAHLLNTGNDTGSSAGGYAFYSSSTGNLNLRMNDAAQGATSVQLVYETGGLSDWHHVVAVFDRTGTVGGAANTVRLYVDNEEKVSAILPDIDGNPYNVVRSLATSTDKVHGEQLYVGSKRTTGGVLNGYMDDIAFYRGALSVADVNTLHNAASLNVDTIATPGITPVMIQNFETNLNRSSETLGVVADDLGNYPGEMREFRQVIDDTRGQVLEVNGLANVNEYISYGDVLNPGDQSYTVSTWFKLEDTGANQTLMSKGANTSSGAEGWAVIYLASSGSLLVRGNHTGDTTGQLAVRQALTVGDDQWHHVALVIDQETGLFEAYLDGRGSGANGEANGWVPDLDEVSSLPKINFTPGVDFTTTQPLLLGHNGTSATGGNSNPTVGRFDDFAVWNRALSAAEISAMIPEPSSTSLLLLALFSSLLFRRNSPK